MERGGHTASAGGRKPGLSLGATYKVMDNLAVFAGVRGVFASNNYNGYVQDVKASYQYQYSVPAQPSMMFPGTEGKGPGDLELDDRGLTMNADQTGFGLTPIVGIDWRINSHLNVAADIPSMFAVGVEYSPFSMLRLRAGYHTYGDKNATQYGNKQDLIDGDTWELTAGAEYDICRWLTISAGWQKTCYDLSDAYMNDLSFVTSSQSFGAGLRITLNKHSSIDLGYMYTKYDDREVSVPSAAGNKVDVYGRTNRVLGLGINLSF